METTAVVVALLMQKWGMMDDVVAMVVYMAGLGLGGKVRAMFEGDEAPEGAIDVDRDHPYHSREVDAGSATERAVRYLKQLAAAGNHEVAGKLAELDQIFADLVTLMNGNNRDGGLKQYGWSLVAFVRQMDGLAPAEGQEKWVKMMYGRFAATVLAYIHFRRLCAAGASLAQDFNHVFAADIATWSNGKVAEWQALQGRFYTLPGYLECLYRVTRDPAKVRSEASFWLELYAAAQKLDPAARQELKRLLKHRGPDTHECLRMSLVQDGGSLNTLVLHTDDRRVASQVFGNRHDATCREAHVIIVRNSTGNIAVLTRGDQRLDLMWVHRELEKSEPGLWHHAAWPKGHMLLNGAVPRPKQATKLTPQQVASLIAKQATKLPATV